MCSGAYPMTKGEKPKYHLFVHLHSWFEKDFHSSQQQLQDKICWRYGSVSCYSPPQVWAVRARRVIAFFLIYFLKVYSCYSPRTITWHNWKSLKAYTEILPSHADVFVLHLLHNFVFNAQTLLYVNRKRTTKSFQFQFMIISEWFTLTNDRVVFCPPS